MKKRFKYILTVILINLVLFYSSIVSHAAAFVPAFPTYIPPTDLTIFSLINNLYGVSAISEGTDSEKLEAYWNLYRAIMGSSFDSFKLNMESVISNAKTGRTIVIDNTLNAQIRQALKYGLQNSIPIGPSKSNAVNPSEWVTRLEEYGVHMTLEQAQQLKNIIGNQYQGASAEPYTLGIMIGNNDSISGDYIKFMPYYVGLDVYFDYLNATMNRFMYGNSNSVRYQYNYRIDLNTMIVGDFINSSYGGNATRVYNNMKFTLGAQQQTTSIIAMSQSANNSVIAETQIPITADSVVENGVLDETKPIVVSLPAIIPVPATNQDDIAGVLDDLGVVPLSETSDVADTLQYLQEESSVKYGNVGDYNIDLTNYFPFCIPFDIGYALNIFAADPEAPSFDWIFPVGYQDGEIIYQTFNIDLSAFDSVAFVLRKCLDVLFIIGLGMITREKFLRG